VIAKPSTKQLLAAGQWRIELGTSDLETARYTFAAPKTGSMPLFSKARCAGYRAQAGVARGVADGRESVNAFAGTEFSRTHGGLRAARRLTKSSID